ncbi:MAG: SIMPL domain-containing protein [Alphaproteobacteria bacterium]|nr:SIMPL domain-containing protein [Alphaproteobacteria bacterium]
MRIVPAALVLALATVLVAPAVAQEAKPEDGLTVVVLSESAQREILRDRLRVQLRVEQTGADAARVQAEINRRMTAALEKAKGAADGAKLRVETGGYWIYQERPKDAPARWRGAQGMTLVGTDAAAILSLAGELQQDGFLMNGLAWELSPEARRRLQDELTTEAIERARARGQLVARAMDATLVRFGRLVIGAAGNEYQPMPRAMAYGEARAAAAPAPVAAEPGVEVVQVGIEAQVLMKPRP